MHNVSYYSFGNTNKVKFRDHYCYKCDAELIILKNSKMVNPKSEEAKYYEFYSGPLGGRMVGACEFIHNVFFCPKCKEDIEFVTQLNQEDIDIIIDKVQRYFNRRGRKISIYKRFEVENGILEEVCRHIDQVKNLCFLIEEKGKETFIYKVQISRKQCWERPYYFDVTKRELINFIKKTVSTKTV